MAFGSASIRNRLLLALAGDDLAALEPRLQRVPLELKSVLVEPGRRIEHVHFIEDGLASVVAVSADLEEIEVGNVGFEGMTGTPVCLGVVRSHMRSFIQIEGSAFRVRADDMRDLIKERPAIRDLLLRYVYVQQTQVACTALANARYSMRECLARWLLMSQDRLEKDDLPLTHEFLSLMLGVRRAGITGELHILEGMHVVRATRGVIRVLDRDRLREIAGGCYGQPEAVYEELIGGPARPR